MHAVLAALLLAAPVPKEGEKPILYLPTKEGTKLVYETKVGDEGGREYTETVAKAEAKGGSHRVTLEQVSGKTTRRTVFEVSATGVARIAVDEKDLTTPVPVLKIPAKAGDKWTANGDRDTYKVGKEEEVEVPAGKFKAIPVESERAVKGPGGRAVTMKTTTWYAPDVGEVKRVGKNLFNQEVTTVLKSITPGKEEKDEPKKDK
jgi:hypothetical protein